MVSSCSILHKMLSGVMSFFRYFSIRYFVDIYLFDYVFNLLRTKKLLNPTKFIKVFALVLVVTMEINIERASFSKPCRNVGMIMIDNHQHIMSSYWSLDDVSCPKQNINKGRSVENLNISLDDCFFQRQMSFTGDGGVIYVNVGTLSMNITNSMFFNCGATSNGGAISFTSQNSFVSKVCANKCSSSQGHFAYIKASVFNHIELLSISLCSMSSTGYYPIFLFTGHQRCDNMNSSLNSASWGSGMSSVSSSYFSSSRCTFANNIASSRACLFLSSNKGNFSFINIVHNINPKVSGVVYLNSGSPFMDNCVFHMNSNTLFWVEFGQLTVTNSFISHDGNLSMSVSVQLSTNNMYIWTNTFQIPYFASVYCNAEMTQPQLNPTPMNSLSSTECVTFERTIDITPDTTMIDTPNSSPKSTFAQTPYETQSSSNQPTFELTPHETLSSSNQPTFELTPHETLSSSNQPTFELTPHETLSSSNQPTFELTPHETLSSSNQPTFELTPHETLSSSNQLTFELTPHETLSSSNQPTFELTPHETPSSSNQPTFEFTPHETLSSSNQPTFEFTPHETLSSSNQPTFEFTPHETLSSSNQPTFELTPYETILMSNPQTPMGTKMQTESESKVTLNPTKISSPQMTVSMSFNPEISSTHTEKNNQSLQKVLVNTSISIGIIILVFLGCSCQRRTNDEQTNPLFDTQTDGFLENKSNNHQKEVLLQNLVD